MVGREVGAGSCGGFRVGFDRHGGDVAGAHEGSPQSFDAVVDVLAEDIRGNVEPGGRRGVRRDVGVLADHILQKEGGI